MRAEETALKRKLTDAEKSRKQLQLELSDRDRTILLLRKVFYILKSILYLKKKYLKCILYSKSIWMLSTYW